MQQNEYEAIKTIYDNLGKVLRDSKINTTSTGFKIQLTNIATRQVTILPSIRETARYIHASEGGLRYWFKRTPKFKKNGFYIEKVSDENQYQLP